VLQSALFINYLFPDDDDDELLMMFNNVCEVMVLKRSENKEAI